MHAALSRLPCVTGEHRKSPRTPLHCEIIVDLFIRDKLLSMIARDEDARLAQLFDRR